MLSCSSARLERPLHYVLGCGSGTYVLTEIHWLQWGGATARGKGLYVFDTCSPTCAADHNVSYHATFVVKGVTQTPRGRIYKKITISYSHGERHSDVIWSLPPFSG